jgi:hypothetical protein
VNVLGGKRDFSPTSYGVQKNCAMESKNQGEKKMSINSYLRNRARYLLALMLVLSLTALPLLPSPRVTRAFAPNPVPPSQAVQEPGAQQNRGADEKALAQGSYAKRGLSFEPNSLTSTSRAPTSRPSMAA